MKAFKRRHLQGFMFQLVLFISSYFQMKYITLPLAALGSIEKFDDKYPCFRIWSISCLHESPSCLHILLWVCQAQASGRRIYLVS